MGERDELVRTMLLLAALPSRDRSNDQMDRVLKTAAAQIEGVTLSLPQPARHGQVLFCAMDMGLNQLAACQGFLTSEGRFVNRVMGKHIAHIAGQEQMRPESERHATQLFSEDLW